MSDIILYSYFRSSTSYRVRVALNLKGLSYTYMPVNLLKQEQQSATYKNLNPSGGVPSIIHNGHTLSQSRAIIEYLDEVFPQHPFFPTNAYNKAKIRQICDTINCEIHPLGNLRVMSYLEKNFAATPEIKEQWIQHWNQQGLEAVEKILHGTAGKYCFGDEISAADIFLIPHLFSANRFKVDLSPYSTILRVNEECLKLKPFQDAHPHKQPDTPAELRT
jgi:maleylacetoacetate isomerase/maleylpyruvate isomerase